VESSEVTNDVVETLSESADEGKTVKKKFVPPVVSVPVDVLEATTFFLPVDSGAVP
jgi:hypothetical protein